MTDESKAKLLMAYKYAAMADQDGIADLLEDVILDVMGGGTPWMVTRETRNTLEPPWTVTCTSIDTATREVKS